MERKKVVIFSEYNGISVSLVEKFLSYFFVVKVVCVKKSLWRKYASYLFSNSFFSIGTFDKTRVSEPDFSVFVSCFYDNLSFYREEVLLREKRRFLFFLSQNVSKERKFAILPYQVYEETGLELAKMYNKSANFQENTNLCVCFVDEIFGPRMVLSPRSQVSSLLRLFFVEENSFFTSKQNYLRVCLLGDFTRKFVDFVVNVREINKKRILFSGRAVSRSFLLEMLREQRTDLSDGFKETTTTPQRAIFDLEVKLDELLDKRKFAEVVAWFNRNFDDFFLERRGGVVEKKNGVVLNRNNEGVSDSKKAASPRFLVKQTRALLENFFCLGQKLFVNVSKYRFSLSSVAEKIAINKKVRTRRFLLWYYGLRNFLVFLRLTVLFLGFILVLPLLPVVLGGASIYLGYRAFTDFNLSRAMFFARISEKISYVLTEDYYKLTKPPIVGNYYLFLGETLSLFRDSSRAFVSAISLVKKISLLYEGSLKNQEVDLNDFSRSVFLDLDSLYFQVSLVEGSLRSFGTKYTFLKPLLDRVDFSKHRQEIASVREITLLLPDILGAEEEKKYLVLFQNNMELRATGGFIGSFAILTFKKGALTNLEVYDVYTADGQLKGYVDPPWQIKTHLNQPAWYLRDSNWDPDFSVSAKRAEWFLDKSLGIEVDGVFSFDTTFVRDLVSVLGKLTIPDYNKTIDDKIFYDVVQYEVEKDFFPGSRQKSNFLTALSKSLLFEIRSAKPKTLLSFLPVFYKNLNERHIQLFFNDDVLQEKIVFLGWDGGLGRTSCFSENCFEDLVALVESNFGVNKANYFVSRSVNIKVAVGDSFIEREMEINFENKAPFALGDKGKYKNYLRVFVPTSSLVERVLVESNKDRFEITPDQGEVRGMKEVGFLVEVPPETAKKVVIVWRENGSLDLLKNGEYRFVFRKQAGVDSIPFGFKLSFPPGFKVASDNLQLTSEGFFVYNQPSLRRDFSGRFYW